MAISSRGCLIPRLLLPVPPDTEEAPGLPRLPPLMIPLAVEGYLAIRALPYMTSGRFVLNMTNRPVLWTDGIFTPQTSPPAIDAGNFSSAMDRWIEDVRFTVFLAWTC
jgi:hypothetical protein